LVRETIGGEVEYLESFNITAALANGVGVPVRVVSSITLIVLFVGGVSILAKGAETFAKTELAKINAAKPARANTFQFFIYIPSLLHAIIIPLFQRIRHQV
jgi:hypothetical protein